MSILRERQQDRRQKTEMRKWSYIVKKRSRSYKPREKNFKRKGVVSIINCHTEVN